MQANITLFVVLNESLSNKLCEIHIFYLNCDRNTNYRHHGFRTKTRQLRFYYNS